MYASTLRSSDVFDADDWVTPEREVIAPRHERGSGYGSRKRPNILAVTLIAVLHVALLMAFLSLGKFGHHHRRHNRLRVEELKFDLAPPPPPSKAAPQQKQKMVDTPIVAEAPIVQTMIAPPPVVVSPAPQLPAPPAPSAAPVVAVPVMAAPGPVSIGKLSPMPGNPPLKYPMSSRMKHEEGIVRLRISVGTDGRVQDISIAQTSGFDTLDKAALDVVRKWRFHPPTRDGVAAEGFGIFPATFKLA